jgi:hypothetical protein
MRTPKSGKYGQFMYKCRNSYCGSHSGGRGIIWQRLGSAVNITQGISFALCKKYYGHLNMSLVRNISSSGLAKQEKLSVINKVL